MKIIPDINGDVVMALSEEEVQYLFLTTADYDCKNDEEHRIGMSVCKGINDALIEIESKKEKV